MTYEFTSRKVDDGAQPRSEMRNLTTEEQVNQAIAGTTLNQDVAVVTEVQLRGIHAYIRACATGLTTSSVETAISAII